MVPCVVVTYNGEGCEVLVREERFLGVTGSTASGDAVCPLEVSDSAADSQLSAITTVPFGAAFQLWYSLASADCLLFGRGFALHRLHV